MMMEIPERADTMTMPLMLVVIVMENPDDGDMWTGVSMNCNIFRKMNIIIMVTAEAAVDDKDED